MNRPSVQIQHEPLEDGMLVRLAGEVDYGNSPQVRASLHQVLAERPGRLIIDLRQVPYMDSSGVATLVEALQNQSAAKHKLVLCGLQPKVRGIFEISRLSQVFLITEDLPAARTA